MEALLTVNGVAFPDPVGYKVDVEPLGEWARNANGDLVGDLVAYKVKLNLSWGVLDGTKFSLLLNSNVPFFATVRYWEPRTNGFETKQFYASPQSGEIALRDSHGILWKNVAFNLVER